MRILAMSILDFWIRNLSVWSLAGWNWICGRGELTAFEASTLYDALMAVFSATREDE